MKTHTNDYKNNIKLFGRELDSVILYNQDNELIVLGNETLNSISSHYEGSILKSVMKQLDIDSNVEIPEGTEISFRLGVKVRNDEVDNYRSNYDYVIFGHYIVYKSEKQKDTNSYKITCYDKMLYAMKDYESMGITYPITVRDYINTVCNHLGLRFENASSTFANYNQQINSELYLDAQGNSLGYTFRDVLDELAQVTASTICINEISDSLEIRYINNTGDTINEDYLKDINVNFGESYGPINTVVLSRSAGADNISLSYPEDLPDEQKIAVKIVDNQIMNGNDRDSYLSDILNRLLGLEYYLNDFSSTGITYYNLCDRYNVQVGEETYSCVMFNDEINITQGLEENIHTDMPDEAETDYTKADKTDRRINQTYLIVDKQNQAIESVISNVTEQNNKISQITQTVDEINAKISDIADITISGESTFATFTLDNINQSEPIQIIVKPINENISYLYPSINLFPSANLFPKVRTIRFTNRSIYELTQDKKYTSYRNYYVPSRSLEEYTLLVKGTDYQVGDTITGDVYQNKEIDYELPDNLLYYDSNTYDEFYLDYDSHTCQITKRCQYNASGLVEPLSNERVVEYEYPTIALDDGDYTLTLLGYEYGYLFIRLMAKNIYTSQFYTKVETDSRINQKADEIELGVSQTLSGYSNTSEMNAAINVKANEINSVVSTKVGKSEVISSINQTSEAITINANKLNLTGYITASDLSGEGTTTIDGSNIKTGRISADRLDTKVITTDNLSAQTINADNIYGGTIQASRIVLGDNSGTNFAVGYDGIMYARNCQVSGEISSSFISGSSIDVVNGIRHFTATSDALQMSTSSGGFLSLTYTTHPYVSALNVAQGSGGILFMSGSTQSDPGSITYGGIDITRDYGGISLEVWSRSGADIVINPGDRSNNAYVWYRSSNYKIAVSSSGPSSLNVKKNLKPLDNEYDKLYKDMQKVNAYNYDYKYKNVNGDLTKDYGFIIDEIEDTKHLSKYFRNYKTKRWIKGNKLINKQKNEDMSKYEELDIKEWDRDSYIKGLFVMIKTLQHKIEKLEEKYEQTI